MLNCKRYYFFFPQLIVLVLLANMAVSTQLLESQSWGYYETIYVRQLFSASMPWWKSQDLGMLSVEEDSNHQLTGIFEDYTEHAVTTARLTTAAALDGGLCGWGPNYWPTGHLAVSTTDGSNSSIDIHFQAHRDGAWQTTQTFLTSMCGGAPFYMVPPASYDAYGVQAMGFAAGAASTTIYFQTNQLITAETYSGTLCLGAYGLYSSTMALVAPYLLQASATPSGNATCLGMVVSNYCPNPNQGGRRTLNVIVYVDSNLQLHYIQYDVQGRAFWSYDPQQNAPYPMVGQNGLNLSQWGTTFGGIWLAQESSSNGHDIVVSMDSADGPTLVILRLGAANPVVVSNCGGGPVSHIPCEVAKSVFSAQQPNDRYGWYVCTRGASQWMLHAVNVGGTVVSTLYTYPQGATPNGTPLANPGQYTLNSSYRKGVIWIPYVNGSTYQFVLKEGDGTNVGTVGYTVPSLNFLHQRQQNPPITLPASRKNTTWDVTTLLSDQKTNYVVDYAMYRAGF